MAKARLRHRARQLATLQTTGRWSPRAAGSWRNIQRVTKLFVTKSVFRGIRDRRDRDHSPTDYPLLPSPSDARLLPSPFGIPAFFLALAPSEGPWRTERLPPGRGPVRGSCRRRGRPRGQRPAHPYRSSTSFDLGLLQSRTAATLDARRGRPLPGARARGHERAPRAARGSPLRGLLLAVYVVVLLLLPGPRLLLRAR